MTSGSQQAPWARPIPRHHSWVTAQCARQRYVSRPCQSWALDIPCQAAAVAATHTVVLGADLRRAARKPADEWAADRYGGRNRIWRGAIYAPRLRRGRRGRSGLPYIVEGLISALDNCYKRQAKGELLRETYAASTSKTAAAVYLPRKAFSPKLAML